MFLLRLIKALSFCIIICHQSVFQVLAESNAADEGVIRHVEMLSNKYHAKPSSVQLYLVPGTTLNIQTWWNRKVHIQWCMYRNDLWSVSVGIRYQRHLIYSSQQRTVDTIYLNIQYIAVYFILIVHMCQLAKLSGVLYRMTRNIFTIISQYSILL